MPAAHVNVKGSVQNAPYGQEREQIIGFLHDDDAVDKWITHGRNNKNKNERKVTMINPQLYSVRFGFVVMSDVGTRKLEN